MVPCYIDEAPSQDSFSVAFLKRVDDLTLSMLQLCEKMCALQAVGELGRSVSPSEIRISTMTLFSKLRPPTGFDLSSIIELYLQEDGIERIRQMLGIHVHIVFPIRKVQKTARGKSINNFFNQLSFWYKDTTKKSIKIFINGNVHITGCRTLREYVWLLGRVCSFLNTVFPPGKAGHCPCVAETIDVQMINTNFHIQSGLDLNKLKRLLLDHGRCATYDREVYPGLNLKLQTSFNREASILIFISGNIIITGVKHFAEIYEAYKFITTFIASNLDTVSKARLFVTEKDKRTPRAAPVYRDGYDCHFLHSCLVFNTDQKGPDVSTHKES